MSKVLLNLSKSGADSGDFVTYFPKHLMFEGDMEVAMVSSTAYYVFPNISAAKGNNQFQYYNGTVNRTVVIPDGLYNIDNIYDEIKRQITAYTDDPLNLVLVPNYSTGKVRVELAGGYTVDFTIANSLRFLLGWDSVVVSVTSEGANPAAVNVVEKILVHCSLCQGGSYLNNTLSDVVGEILLLKPPGSQLAVLPSPLIWLPMPNSISRDISDVRTYFTDQNNNILNFLQEPTSLSIYIRPVK